MYQLYSLIQMSLSQASLDVCAYVCPNVYVYPCVYLCCFLLLVAAAAVVVAVLLLLLLFAFALCVPACFVSLFGWFGYLLFACL